MRPASPFASSPPFFLAGLLLALLFWTGCDTVGLGKSGSEEEIIEAPPELTLLGQLAPLGFDRFTDVTGYVDPQTGTEYALMGASVAGEPSSRVMLVIDVSAPFTPRHVATVPGPSFDVRTWQTYAYSVTGGGDRSGEPEGQITDLTDPTNPVVVGAFPSAHNLTIDDQGLLFLEAPGLRILDASADPLAPTLVWDNGNNFGGHDATVVGQRLYDFHGRSGTNIYDLTTLTAPQLLATIDDPAISYHHSGAPTPDAQHLFIDDELARDNAADISVWDISDLANPTRVAEITDSTAIVHNLYVIEDYAYVSYYTAGLRIYDVSDPTMPTLVAEHDTSPEFDTPTFDGAFGIYPLTPSGTIYVSDMQNGLYVFSFTALTPAS